MILRKGDTGTEVKKLQSKLSTVLGFLILADGIFGSKTEHFVKMFQTKQGLYSDGIVGRLTMSKLDEQLIYSQVVQNWWIQKKPEDFTAEDFTVFVDAGHGTIDDFGNYTTSEYIGKKYHHNNSELHFEGWFYEGFENHIIAEMFIRELTKLGINTVRTYDSTKDTSLGDRARRVKEYLNRGRFGYLHSIHSNAAPLSYTKEQLDKAIGFCCFTTTEHNFSDEIAEPHIKRMKAQFPLWYFRDNPSDGDLDQEANFKILRDTNVAHYPLFGSILDEFGFYTSESDSNFIIQNREKRVEVMVKTALWTRNEQLKKLEAL